MNFEQLKINFCNLLFQTSINDLEQFLKWIDKHIQGYNKFGLNYIKSITSEFSSNTNSNNNIDLINQENKIDCECGKSYVLNVKINSLNKSCDHLIPTVQLNCSNNRTGDNSGGDGDGGGGISCQEQQININRLNNKRVSSSSSSSSKLNKLSNKKAKLNIQLIQSGNLMFKEHHHHQYMFTNKNTKDTSLTNTNTINIETNPLSAISSTTNSSSSASSTSSFNLDKDENNNDLKISNNNIVENIPNEADVDDDNDEDEPCLNDNFDLNDDIDDNDALNDDNQQQQQNLDECNTNTIQTIVQQITAAAAVAQSSSISKQNSNDNNNSNNKIKCPICSKPYSSNHTMLRHKMSIHDKLVKYCCKICQRSFFRKDKLATHISNHQDYDTYVCCYCPTKYTCKSKQLLKAHFKKEHLLHEDDAFFNDLFVKCQCKQTIDIESNMIINYADSTPIASNIVNFNSIRNGNSGNVGAIMNNVQQTVSSSSSSSTMSSPSTSSSTSLQLATIEPSNSIEPSSSTLVATTTNTITSTTNNNNMKTISKVINNLLHSKNLNDQFNESNSKLLNINNDAIITVAATGVETIDPSINILRSRKSMVLDMLNSSFDNATSTTANNTS